MTSTRKPKFTYILLSPTHPSAHISRKDAAAILHQNRHTLRRKERGELYFIV
jgi:hypothetical protein